MDMASAIGPGAAAPAVLSLLPSPTARRFAPRFFRSLLPGRLPRRLALGALAGLLLGALRRRRLARSPGGLAGSRAAARPAPSFRPAHLGLGAADTHVGASRSARQLVIRHSQTVLEIVRHDAPSNLRVSVESPSLTKHTADVKRAPPVARAASVPALRAGIEVENRLDRAAAHRAEGHAIAREHDAVNLGPEIPLRLVVRAFEGADASGKRGAPEQRRVARLFFAEERIHLGFRPVRGADLAPPHLNLLRVSPE